MEAKFDIRLANDQREMTLNQMQRGTGKERKAVTEKKNKLTKKKTG